MDWPTALQELERKVLETITKLCFDFEKETITRAEALSGLRTIWNTTAGIVGSDIMQLLPSLIKRVEQRDLGESVYDDVAVYIKGKHVAVVTRADCMVCRTIYDAVEGLKVNVQRQPPKDSDIFPRAAAIHRFGLCTKGLDLVMQRIV